MSFEAKYRKKSALGDAPPVPPAAASSMEVLKAAANGERPQAKAKDDYKAFQPQVEAQFDLWVRPNAANESPGSSIPYSRRSGTEHDDGWFVIIMHFDSGPVQSVRLHGRNLDGLYLKLLAHEVVYVREFDPRLWPEVAEGEACITAIDIRYKPLPKPKKNDEDALPGENTQSEGTATH